MKTLFLSFLMTCASVAFANGLPTMPYIYVQGSAETEVAPDTVRVSFGISSADADQAKAKEAVSTKSASVFKLFETMGLTDDAITAFDLSVQENFEYENGKRTSRGYTVARNFSVKLTDFKLYPALLDALVELRVESINGTQPSYSKATAESAKLKTAAIEQARQQANDIATSMNARVKSVFAVSPIAFGEIPSAIFGGSGGAIPMSKNVLAMSARGASADKYVFEKITLSERLHVIFLIEPKK